MLDFAAKLTCSPWDMAEADVEGLRQVGRSGRATLDVVLVTSSFAFVNRIASGLGVELEPAS